MRILGIETSCDETGAAVVEDGRKLLSNVVMSSLSEHAKYGGVVPEVAARAQIEAVIPVIEQALNEAGCSWSDIDGIAVTKGAGLGGSLLIGVLTARTLALLKNKPLYGVNHVEGHVYANFITETVLPGYQLPAQPPRFPFLALIVSGGHTQLVLFQDHFAYQLLGQTHDDAIGEAFDKVAKIIGLPYPGGPSIAKAAVEGNPQAIALPRAHMAGAYDFSFSGLKTAVLRAVQALCGKSFDFPSFELAGLLNASQRADIAASFQTAAIQAVVEKTISACREFHPTGVVLAGGVAANSELRRQLGEQLAVPLLYPDIKLCTDNGAMIATLGCYHASHSTPVSEPYSLEIQPSLSM